MYNVAISYEGILIEFDEHDAHVVAAELFLIGVFSEEVVKHLFEYSFGRVSFESLGADEVDKLLTVVFESLPDAVTA